MYGGGALPTNDRSWYAQPENASQAAALEKWRETGGMASCVAADEHGRAGNIIGLLVQKS